MTKDNEEWSQGKEGVEGQSRPQDRGIILVPLGESFPEQIPQ